MSLPDKAASPQQLAPQPPVSEPARPHGPTDLLRRLWVRHQPLIRERIADLEQFASGPCAAAEVTEAARLHALDIAHKLAGSLGMFGYMEGTQAARALEQYLEAESTLIPERITALVAQLQAALPS